MWMPNWKITCKKHIVYCTNFTRYRRDACIWSNIEHYTSIIWKHIVWRSDSGTLNGSHSITCASMFAICIWTDENLYIVSETNRPHRSDDTDPWIMIIDTGAPGVKRYHSFDAYLAAARWKRNLSIRDLSYYIPCIQYQILHYWMFNLKFNRQKYNLNIIWFYQNLMIVPHNNKGYRLCTHDNKKHKGELSCVYGLVYL